MQLLTSSRLYAARSCMRLHKFRYLDGYRPADEANSLTFGRLIHSGLEGWWRAPDGSRAQNAIAMMRGAEPLDMAKALPMMAGYHMRWKGEPLETLAVEKEFESDLINPETGAKSRTWRVAGKIDAIARDPRTGLTYIVEHKTSSMDISPGSDYWRKLRIDAQVSMYYEGAKALGFDVGGVLYDVLGKPKLRLKNGETPDQFQLRVAADIAAAPDKYYVRGEVVRLDAEMDEARWDVWQTARAMQEAEKDGRAPRNPGHCMTWGRPCEFFGICCGEASLDDPTKFKKLESVNPELETTNANSAA